MLKTKLSGIKLANPTVLASGIMGISASSLNYAAQNGAGAVTFKSIGLSIRHGHPGPVVLGYGPGFINAVGLCNPGIDECIKEVKASADIKVPVIANIFAPTIEEFGRVAALVNDAKPDLIEVNISCPNVESEFGAPFATDEKISAKVVEIVKNNTSLPVIVKLSPNVDDIKKIAMSVEAAGADMISAINTVGPGMVIDIKTAKPILSNKFGGLSGPAIKPIAIKSIYDIFSVVDIPLIGIGGVTYGVDAVEMMMAGACAVGIGTGVYYRGVEIFDLVSREIKSFLEENSYSSVKEIIGVAHE